MLFKSTKIPNNTFNHKLFYSNGLCLNYLSVYENHLSLMTSSQHPFGVNPSLVSAGVSLHSFRFPGDKSKTFIYDGAARTFKLRPRGGPSLPSGAAPGDTSACALNACDEMNASWFTCRTSVFHRNPRPLEKEIKRGNDGVLHPRSGRCAIRGLLQAPVQVEGKHLQAALQGPPGLLCGLSVLQPVLQVNSSDFHLVCVCGFIGARTFLARSSQVPPLAEAAGPVRANRPLLRPVHQHQLHPGPLRAG